MLFMKQILVLMKSHFIKIELIKKYIYYFYVISIDMN
jgi:hypothetical protein